MSPRSPECGHLPVTARRLANSHQTDPAYATRSDNFVSEPRGPTATFIADVTSAESFGVIGAQQLR